MGHFINWVYAQDRVQQVPGAFSRADLFDRLAHWALYFGGAVAVIYLIYGGILYITAGGDPEKATQGKNAVTYAIIGIIVIALALVAVRWISQALNTDNPLSV